MLKVIILWQIVALLMPIYPFAPYSLVVKLCGAEKEGKISYHRCGCSTERVLSRTCCCFLSKGRCFSSYKPRSRKWPGGKKKPAATYLCTAPCGRPAKLKVNASTSFEYLKDNLNFNQFTLSIPVTAFAWNSPEGLLNQPRVPPPEVPPVSPSSIKA